MRLGLCTALLLSACGSIEPTSWVESEIESWNALSLNALSLNALSLNALSLNALSLNGSTITSTDACATADGRQVLKYVVGCALPQGTALVCPGYSDVFYGNLGLAPEWSSTSIGLTSQQWISACLLAHVNSFAVPVQISLAGPHPALTRSQPERDLFQYSEATYYGNLFTALPPITSTDGIYSGTQGRVACQQEVAGTTISDWYLKLRICGVPGGDGYTRCHFRDAGRCTPQLGQVTSACTQGMDGYSWRCAGGQIYPGWPKEPGHEGLANDQAITVYLRTSDADDLRTQACQVALQQGWVSTCDVDEQETHQVHQEHAALN
jgi:hypothetical protein